MGGQALSGRNSSMFFLLSKLFWVLIQPLNAFCILGGMGFLVRFRWDLAGQRMMNAALIGILVTGLLPVGPLLLTYLETRYPASIEMPEKIDGIVLLGGAFEAHTAKATGQISANDNIERAFCFVDLAKKHPEAKLVFSGGAGDLVHPDAMEADVAKRFFALAGLGDRTIVYEEKSRNTYENVLYSMEALDPKNTQNWVVTTSAYHMPRTMGIFKKFGWRITPYQCDMRTDGTYDVFRTLPNITGNFQSLNIAMKEIVGAAVYYVTDKSAFILPPSSGKLSE